MAIKIEKFSVSTKPLLDVVDITQKIESFVQFSSVKTALLNVSTNSPNASIFTFYNDNNNDNNKLIFDLIKALDELPPLKPDYKSEKVMYESRQISLLKAAIFGSNTTLNIIDGKIELPLSKRIFLIDFSDTQTQTDVYITITY